MPAPGYVFKNGLPLNAEPPPQQTDEKSAIRREPRSHSQKSQAHVPATAPTQSHALANADHEEKGVAQRNQNIDEVKDLGWNEHLKDVPTPLVGGLLNEELWTLVRRFDKVCLLHTVLNFR